MGDVFHQVYLHFVFTPKYRQALIRPEWEERLHKYISVVIEGRGHKMLAIGGMPDHIHIFIGYLPGDPIPDLIREVKKASNFFIKEQKLSKSPFAWQAGYGVFSHCRRNVSVVCNYIERQKQHHVGKTFKMEFAKMFFDPNGDMGEKKTFEWFDDE